MIDMLGKSKGLRSRLHCTIWGGAWCRRRLHCTTFLCALSWTSFMSLLFNSLQSTSTRKKASRTLLCSVFTNRPAPDFLSSPLLYSHHVRHHTTESTLPSLPMRSCVIIKKKTIAASTDWDLCHSPILHATSDGSRHVRTRHTLY